MKGVQLQTDEAEGFFWLPSPQLHHVMPFFALRPTATNLCCKYELLWCWPALPCPALPREQKPCRRWGCSLVAWTRWRNLHTPKLLEFVKPKKNKSLGIYIFEGSLSLLEFQQTHIILSIANTAYQILGQNCIYVPETADLWSKNDLQSLTRGGCHHQARDRLGKLSMSIAHCYEENYMTSM